MQIIFEQQGTFKALWAAEVWCKENGISYGSSCVACPTGLMRGDYVIAKWRNLSKSEQATLDGTMSGDFRNGPVTITLRDLPQN